MERVPRPRYNRPRPNYWGGQHKRIAKEQVRNHPTCAYAHLTHLYGPCDGPLQGDHIIPRSMGGTNHPSNYQTMCRRHNIAKGGANRK